MASGGTDWAVSGSVAARRNVAKATNRVIDRSVASLTALRSQHQQQQDALQRQLTVRGVVPFVARVDAAAVASGSDADCRDAQRKRNVRIRGGDARLRADAEMAVEGEQVIIERGAVCSRVQAASGAVADTFYGEGSLSGGAPLAQIGSGGIRRKHRVFDGAMQFDFEADQLLRRCGAEIEACACLLRNRVDRTAALDGADVQRSAALAWLRRRGERGNGMAENGDRIGRAGVCPGVSAGTGNGGEKAAAAQSFRDGDLVACAVQHDVRGDAVAPW